MRLGSTVLRESTPVVASPASLRTSSGCRSYPRTGVARARNGWRRSRVGRRRRSSSAPTTKPSRFFCGKSLFQSLFLYLSLSFLSLSFSITLSLLLLCVVLCSFRGLSTHGTAVTPAFTSIRLTAPFVYMRARAFSRWPTRFATQIIASIQDEERINTLNGYCYLQCSNAWTRLKISLWLLYV